MTTPTPREALEELRSYCLMGPLPTPPSLLRKVDAALAAQPELPEPVADVDEYGKVKWRDAVRPAIKLYTAAQLQQAVEQARASAPQGVPQHFSRTLEKLQRFEECANDFDADGVDIGREWFDVLTVLGFLKRVQRSPAMWQITEAGESLLAEAPQPVAQEASDPAKTLGNALNQLLADAEKAGYIITVDLLPQKPLAMGNVKMLGAIRPSRALYSAPVEQKDHS